MSNPAPFRLYPCGDHAVTIELGDRADPSINNKVISVFHHLQNAALTGVLDIIPSYHTVTLVYDLALLTRKHPGSSVYEKMCRHLLQAADLPVEEVAAQRPVVKIPVCYDASLAPDLPSLAAAHQLRMEEVIAFHTAATYRVYLIGFLPGFAYMGNVHEKIATPRKANPRVLVPEGSVGIAGKQTGIYPLDSPGGWQLIGQTPLKMFSASKADPCFLQPGDEVQFFPVSLTEFTKLKQA